MVEIDYARRSDYDIVEGSLGQSLHVLSGRKLIGLAHTPQRGEAIIRAHIADQHEEAARLQNAVDRGVMLL